jgi:hypothetical protein
LGALCEFRVVQCHTDPATARRRVAEHVSTRRVHADSALLAVIERNDGYFSDFRRVSLDAPTISVDTTDGYEPTIEAIVEFVEGR